MAGKSKYARQKPEVKALWEQGLGARAITAQTGVPVSTVNRWMLAFAADPDLDPDQAEPPSPKRSKPRAKPRTRPEPPPPAKSKIVAIEGGRAQVAKFHKVVKVTTSIMDDVNQPGGVRIQAANTMLKAIALSAELPQHILDEVEQHSLRASVDEIEGRGDEAIAQNYRELLG